jgi:glycosyltransferase involved in cell wall biosynthesis
MPNNNSYPKISIITPVLNRVQFLEETILSVISQGYPNLEYIIIDGGSTDGTLEIIKKHEKSISYWVSEPDLGMYPAIQKGFNRSTGEIMAWLNSDDLYKPGSLKMIASIFNDTEVEWITGMGSLYNKVGNCVKTNNLAKWSKSRVWLNDYKWIQQENTFWKRSLWEKSGGFISTDLKYAGDFELWCRFFKHAELYSVHTSFAGFRLHGSQFTSSFKNEYEAEARRIAKEFKPLTLKEKRKYYILVLFKGLQWVVKYTLIFLFLESFVSKIIDKLHNFPRIIRYNFNEFKWEIAWKKTK